MLRQLDRGDRGQPSPGDRAPSPRRLTDRLPAVGLLAAGAALAVVVSLDAGPWAHVTTAASAVDYVDHGRIALLSGHDDNGLLAEPRVALLAHPGDDAALTAVPDGTLVRVLASHGEWREIGTLEGEAVRGWVSDFYVRDVARLVGTSPSCEVRVGGEAVPAGQQIVVEDVRADRVRVRLASGRGWGWVDRSTVRELPPGPADECGPVATG